MSEAANPARGEAAFRVGDASIRLRPTFARLVAAENELGSLFALADRACAGEVKLGEVAVLFDHLSDGDRPDTIDRQRIGDALAAGGLAAVMAPLRIVLVQILEGR